MVARCSLRIFSPTLPVGSVAECSQCSAPAGARAQQPHTVQGPSFLCADLVQSTPGFVAGGWLSVLILKCTRIFLPWPHSGSKQQWSNSLSSNSIPRKQKRPLLVLLKGLQQRLDTLFDPEIWRGVKHPVLIFESNWWFYFIAKFDKSSKISYMQCTVDMRIENKTIYQFTIYIYSVVSHCRINVFRKEKCRILYIFP